jgi:hypothetical protein
MPQRPWKTARNPLKVRKYPVATLLLQALERGPKKAIVSHPASSCPAKAAALIVLFK